MGTKEDEDETRLQFYHGALMDEDIDKLLKSDGDYLLQSRYMPGHTRPRLCFVIKKNGDVKRYEIKRNEKGVRMTQLSKTFPNLQALIDHLLQNGIEDRLLVTAVTRGKFQLHHKDIRLMKKLGAGAYGTVYKGYLLPREGAAKDNKKTTVAVKRIDSEGTDEQALTDMMKEARVMQLYHHANIVKFYGYIVDRMPYLLVMEYCDGGSVEDKLRDEGDIISIATRVDWCYQGATGLEYLHSKNCIHRDIATRNCLMNGDTLKLADFGMCRATSIYKVDLSKPLNVRWLAPEVWRTGETKPCTDVYAFGVMIWELFEIPYNSPYSAWKAGVVKQKVMAGYRMKPQEVMPKEMAEVMSLAWNHKPEKRPSATELRNKLKVINKIFNKDKTFQEPTVDSDGTSGPTKDSTLTSPDEKKSELKTTTKRRSGNKGEGKKK